MDTHAEAVTQEAVADNFGVAKFVEMALKDLSPRYIRDNMYICCEQEETDGKLITTWHIGMFEQGGPR